MKHQKINNNKQCKRRTSTSWEILPLPALGEIMQYLTDTDKVVCAQVCRQWKFAFENPMLWRERIFEFGGSRFRPLGQRAVLYAQKMGRHLHHMTIVCRQLTSHTCESMIRCMEVFFELLTSLGPPELSVLEIEGLELEFWRYGNLRDQVAECLIRFLHSQGNLKIFAMPSAQFAMEPGLDVLNAISQGNGSKLETLLFEFFFHQRQAVFQSNRFTRIMEQFTNLHTITMNYCCMSDNLVTTWADTLQGKLKSLRFRCCDNEPHGHVISNTAWSNLTSACPGIQVEIAVSGFGSAGEVIPILAYPMPIVSFTFFTGYDNGEELKVARFVCRMISEGGGYLTHVDMMLCELSPLDIEQLQDLNDDMRDVAVDNGVELVLRDDVYH